MAFSLNAKLVEFIRYSESRLMLSHFEIPFTIASYIKTSSYCYNSVNVITFGLAQSDHIKRLLLYYNEMVIVVIFFFF